MYMNKITNHREQIAIIRSDMLHGKLTIEQAKTLVKPIIDDMNNIAEKIAKEFGKKPYKFTFNYVTR